jgi:hypothetical protein
MRLRRFGRLACGLVLALSLAGCMDVDVNVKVKSMTEAQAVMTQTVTAQAYVTIKASMGTDAPPPIGFCERLDGGTLTENADGSATCTIVTEGSFDNFSVDNGADKVDFTTPGPGLVRVAFALHNLTDGGMTQAMSTSSPTGDGTNQEMLTAFAGHFLTITFSGGEIIDTNMTLAADRRSATEKIPFSVMINDDTAGLPDEIYAVVKLD